MNILYYSKRIPLGGGVANVGYYLQKVLAKKVNVSLFPQSMREKDYLINSFNVWKKFVRKEFDIIHFNMTPNWIDTSSLLLKFARGKGTHTVLNIHGIIQLEHKLNQTLDSLPTTKLLSTIKSCDLVDKIVVSTENMATKVTTWYGINRNKIIVIPHGVDAKKFYECDDKLMLEGNPAILYVGRVLRAKGVDILMQAIIKLRSELPNMKLHLVGHGHITEFQRLAKEQGIERNVVFHGLTAYSAIPRYYKSADICIVPSKFESFGIILLEAMASGIPLIASNTAGFREIVSHGKDGILFKSEDADALSKAILTLYQDPDLRKKISHNALKTAATYSWENIADKYIALYRYLCE